MMASSSASASSSISAVEVGAAFGEVEFHEELLHLHEDHSPSRMLVLPARSSPMAAAGGALAREGADVVGREGGEEGGAMGEFVGEEAVHLVVIPGNPGIVDFYRDFMRHVHDLHDGRFPVVGLSHQGHDGAAEEEHRVHDLDEQIQHKRVLLRELADRSRHPNTSFVLLGHSIGAYMCLRLNRDYREELSILRTVNMFPTFQYLYEGLAPPVKLLIQPTIRSLAASAVPFLPNFVLQYFVDRNSKMGPHAKEVVKRVISRKVVHNILHLAYFEAQNVREPDMDMLEPHMENLDFLYGRADQYTPLEQFYELTERFPEGSFHLADDGIDHAFCICPEQSQAVAAKVAALLQDFLPPAGGNPHEALMDDVLHSDEEEEA